MLRGIAGWLLILGVIYVPWHEGGVAPLAAVILSSLVFLAALLWLWGHALGKTLPRVPLACLACVTLLLAQGWWMTINARQYYDGATHTLLPVHNLWPGAPGSVDAPASEAATLGASAMLLALCIACDLGRYPKWRRRFVYAIAINGAAVAAFGLFKSVGGDILSSTLGLMGSQGTSFATFSYHGNAGSFLLLCLPMAFALLLNTWHRSPRLPRLILSGIPLAIIAAGALVNVSRAAQAITILMMAGLMVWSFVRAQADVAPPEGATDGAPRDRHVTRRIVHLAIALVALVAMICGAAATTSNRWAKLPGQLSTKNDRLIMWKVCWYWLEDAGPLGYGPGTYKLFYPTTPNDILSELYPRWIVHPHTAGGPVSIWSYVYNDYLQLAVEWGWLGVAAWMALLFGGVGCAAMAARRRPGVTFTDATRAGCIAFAVGAVLVHALVDYPLQVTSLQYYAGICAGLGWGALGWRMEPHHPEPIAARLGKAAETFKYN